MTSYRKKRGLLLGLFLSVLFFQPGFSQEYAWPTDASRLMTSSFGEYRPGHFHAGMDIKTWGNIGYKVFAIGDGSIVRVRISPYGYGRAVYLKLANGITVVYAHLSRFSDRLEEIMKTEQERRQRFAVQKHFRPGEFTVGKGEIIGYTGDTGNGVPHLHIDMRDTEDRPFNPLQLGFRIKDTKAPTIQALAVTPLDGDSHVDRDFQPKVINVQKDGNNHFRLYGAIAIWGKVGISVSAYDQAEGAWNRFAPYRYRLSIDGNSVFEVRYDRFPFELTSRIDVDRDYRLKNWGHGLFQKLYRDVGNELPFYRPAFNDAGVIYCAQRESLGERDASYDSGGSQRWEYPLVLDEGEHTLAIEVSDYWGNTSVLEGSIRVAPLRKVVASTSFQNADTDSARLEPWMRPEIRLGKYLFEDYIRFRVESDLPFVETPYLFVEVAPWEKSYVPLHLISPDACVGILPWTREDNAVLTAETVYLPDTEYERVVRDTLEIFRITTEGGTLVSPDGKCRVIFSRGDLYRSLLGTAYVMPCEHPHGVLGVSYAVYPDDVPLKGSVQITLEVPRVGVPEEKLALYGLSDDGEVGYVGGAWKNESLSAWVGSLGRYTVLQDTLPPEILFVTPGPDARISDRTPQITVGFVDSLSGIGGEDDYIVQLDGRRLIVEYRPSKDRGVHQVETPLKPGEHVIDVMIRDRSGNVAERRSRFFVVAN